MDKLNAIKILDYWKQNMERVYEDLVRVGSDEALKSLQDEMEALRIPDRRTTCLKGVCRDRVLQASRDFNISEANRWVSRYDALAMVMDGHLKPHETLESIDAQDARKDPPVDEVEVYAEPYASEHEGT